MLYVSNPGGGNPGGQPNPFQDVATSFAPVDLRGVLRWCEYVYLTFGTFRSVSRRVVRYFLTEVTLNGESDSERESIEDFLRDSMHLMRTLSQLGDDYMCYGNVFVSLYFPYIRVLECTECKTCYNTDRFPEDRLTYTSSDMSYSGTCPKCRHQGKFTWSDRRSPNKEDIKLVSWSPHEILIDCHPVSGSARYFWQMPQQLVQKVEEGDLHAVRHTPRAMLKCIKEASTSQPYFQFSSDALFHLRDSTLAGVKVSGWGIPPLLPNFKLIYYIQVLRRLDEAIAHDFIVPFRVLSPAMPKNNHGMAQDALASHAMSEFTSSMHNMVRKHRQDPTAVQVTPYPIQAQSIGGEGKALTPTAQISQALEELLNAMDYPAELYRGNLSLQTSPVALRLFEKSWGTLVDGYNELIHWILEKVCRHFLWGKVSGKLQSVTLADDLERKALSLQAAAGMDISKATAYRPFNINFMDEQRRIVEEQQAIAQLQQKAQEEASAQSGLDGGSSGGGGMASSEATPGDVHEQARNLAQQLLFQTPETLRRGELIKIKHSNPTLHALVIQEMNNARQDMSRQGGAMMMEQTKQEMSAGGGGMVATASARDLPSAVHLKILVSQEVSDYTTADLMKIACDIGKGGPAEPAAREAFHFVFARLCGWE